MVAITVVRLDDALTQELKSIAKCILLLLLGCMHLFPELETVLHSSHRRSLSPFVRVYLAS